MKKWVLCLLAGALLSGCAMRKDKKIVVSELTEEKITECVYTRESLSFDAFFLRYRFYSSGGERLFSYEKRERPGRYGPAVEEDTVAKGERTLTEEEWSRLFSMLSDGTVAEREDSAESGDTGPWVYLYWDGDAGSIQAYTFPSQTAQEAFEAFCDGLCDGDRAAG